MSDNDPLQALQSLHQQYVVHASDGNIYGPVPMRELIAWARAQRIAPETLITEEGTDTWRRADTFSELRSVLFNEAQLALNALREGRAPAEMPPVPQVESFPYPPYNPSSPLTYHGPRPGSVTTNGMAVASLVCGIAGFLLCPIVLGTLGIVFGVVAHSQINASRGTQKGSGMATAGVIVGAISIPLGCIVAAAIRS